VAGAVVVSVAAARREAGEMNMFRLLRHAFSFTWQTKRRFPATALAAIEAAITATERLHSGEIRVVLETRLDADDLWRGTTPRERAIALFAQHRVWDTELDNGVLIYVLMADRDVEIVADRGFNGRVTAQQWDEVCRTIEGGFRRGDFVPGLQAGIAAAGELIARHYPWQASDRNELPNAPILA